jgi:hypothetical protein
MSDISRFPSPAECSAYASFYHERIAWTKYHIFPTLAEKRRLVYELEDEREYWYKFFAARDVQLQDHCRREALLWLWVRLGPDYGKALRATKPKETV